MPERLKKFLSKFEIRWIFPLGKIAGIPVRSHLLFWVVFLLLLEPLGFSLLFLCCLSLLAHEFGHVLAGKKLGVKTESVTLLPVGAIASMAMPRGTRKELIIAMVGPLVSIVLGVAFLFFALPLPESLEVPKWNTVSELCFYVGSINLIVGIFNLFPIFPMDGGRMLRALLAEKFGLLKGTKIALGVSFVLLVAIGSWALFHSLFFVFVVLVFVGLMALAEKRATELEVVSRFVEVFHSATDEEKEQVLVEINKELGLRKKEQKEKGRLKNE